MNDNKKVEYHDLFSGCGSLKETVNKLLEDSIASTNFEKDYIDFLSNLLEVVDANNDSVPPIEYYKNCTFKKGDIIIINGDSNKIYTRPETQRFFSKVKAIFSFACKIFSSNSESDDNYSNLILT